MPSAPPWLRGSFIPVADTPGLRGLTSCTTRSTIARAGGGNSCAEETFQKNREKFSHFINTRRDNVKSEYPVGTTLTIGGARFEVMGTETKTFNVMKRSDDMNGETYLMSDASIASSGSRISKPK